jgi:AcrR family transcriptional regulator
MPRKYELRARAARQEDTRRRIVDATVELHRTIGPSRTSISAIAKRAGVQRHTLYRYFPDELSVFKACSERYRALNPLPDPGTWRAVADPRDRLRIGLNAAYAYYGRHEELMTNVLRDAEVMGPPIGTAFFRHRDEMLAVLGRGWRPRRRGGGLIRAVLRLALDFQTWRLLVRQGGLDPAEAVEAMAALVELAGAGPAAVRSAAGDRTRLGGRRPRG